jgi:hypothetical protein
MKRKSRSRVGVRRAISVKTSRAVVRRSLDERDQSITLATISRAATVLGKQGV